MARAPAQILPAGQLTARPRRGQVQGRSQRPHRAVPLPRLPHPDPVDPIDRRKLTNPLTWRARCGESRTPGSAGGLWKPTTGNRGRAPQPDPTGVTPATATNTSPSSSTSPPSAPARHGRWRWSKAAPNRHSRPGCPSNPRPGARASKSWAIDRFTGFKTATVQAMDPLKRSTVASSTYAAPPSASATSPTTSPKACSKSADSETNYTPDCEEPH